MVILFYPLYVRLRQYMPQFWASLVSTATVLILIIIPVFVIAAGIAHESQDLVHVIGSVPYEKFMMNAHAQAAQIGIDLDQFVKDVAQRIANQAGQLALYIIGNALNIFIGTFVTLMAIFFFFRDGQKIVINLPSVFPLNQEWCDTLIKEIGKMIKANITASLLAASIQGSIGGLLFALLDIPAPILWGTVMGFFSILPFIGSWIVWMPAAAGFAIAGHFWEAIILTLTGFALIHPVDNVLRPIIVASATHINGLLIFIGLLGGVNAFGVSGILLGPVLIIIAVTLFKHQLKLVT